MRLALRALSSVALAAVILASACGDADRPPAETEQAKACAAYGAAVCGCDVQFTWCKKREAAYCLQALALPDTGFTIDRLHECTSSLGASPCGGTTVPGCGLTFGARTLGSACLSNQQCTSGLCGGGSWLSCGKCVARLGLGTSGCVPLACDDGLYCGGDGMCATQLALGEGCNNVYACAPPNACVGGVCAPPLATGSNCTYTSDCQFPEVCVGSTRTCGLLPAPLQAGETCPGAGTCDGAKGLFCALGPSGTGTCQPKKTLAVGATCEPYDSATQCAAGADCARRGSSDTFGCAAFLPEASACELASGAVPCEPWLFCSAQTQTCRRPPVPSCG